MENNLHCLTWTSGDVPYKLSSAIIENIFKKAEKIYVKGLDKKKWLEKFVKKTTSVIDMLDMNCPSLHQLLHESCSMKPCNHHENKINLEFVNCALRNVKLLSAWLNKNV